MPGRRSSGSAWPYMSHAIAPSQELQPLCGSYWPILGQSHLLEPGTGLTLPELHGLIIIIMLERFPKGKSGCQPPKKGVWTDSPKLMPALLKLYPICLFFKPPRHFLKPQGSAGHDLKIIPLVPFYRRRNKGPEKESGSPKFTQHTPSSHFQFPERAKASVMSFFPAGSIASPLPGLAERICQLSACLSN